jgi:hypothetical protein
MTLMLKLIKFFVRRKNYLSIDIKVKKEKCDITSQRSILVDDKIIGQMISLTLVGYRQEQKRFGMTMVWYPNDFDA